MTETSSARRVGTVVLAVVVVIATVTYPFLVYFAVTRFGARAGAVLVLAVAVVVAARKLRGVERGELWKLLRAPLGIALLSGATAISGDPRLVYLVPVWINLLLLLEFGGSLRGDTPIIERYARLQEPNLSDAERSHCRATTVVWTVFFLVNGLVALVRGLWAYAEWWAIYNGGLAYGLMGLLLSGEFIVRKVRFRRYGANPVDRVFAWFFPASVPAAVPATDRAD